MLFQFTETLKSMLEREIQPTPQVLIPPPFVAATLNSDPTPVIEIALQPRDWQNDMTARMPSQRYFNHRCRVSLLLRQGFDYRSVASQISSLLILKQQPLIDAISTEAQSCGQYNVQEMIEKVTLKTTDFDPLPVTSAADQGGQSAAPQTLRLHWQLCITGLYSIALKTPASEYTISKVKLNLKKTQEGGEAEQQPVVDNRGYVRPGSSTISRS